MIRVMLKVLLVLGATLFAGALQAQTADLPFSGLAQDGSAPVEITADTLALSQADGTAEFTGNVKIVQGGLTMTAGALKVFYKPAAKEGEQGQIDRLEASGGVQLLGEKESASAGSAVYTLDQGSVIMSGGVSVKQGAATISGDRLTINIKTGTGRVEGNVKTVLTPGGN